MEIKINNAEFETITDSLLLYSAVGKGDTREIFKKLMVAKINHDNKGYCVVCCRDNEECKDFECSNYRTE